MSARRSHAVCVPMPYNWWDNDCDRANVNQQMQEMRESMRANGVNPYRCEFSITDDPSNRLSWVRFHGYVESDV